MKMGQYQLSFLSGLLAAFGLGILCCAWLHIPFAEYLPYLITLLLLAAFASSILVLKQSERTWIAFVGLFFMLGIFRFAAVYELPTHDVSRMVGQNITLSGIIAEPPRLRTDVDGIQHIRYTVSVHRIVQGREEQAGSGKILVYTRRGAEEDSPVGQIGDAITAEGKVRRPVFYQNPGQINTRFLLRCEGITAGMSARESGIKIIPNEEPTYVQMFLRLAAQIRAHYFDRMTEVMPRSDAAAIFAMLFGGYEGIRPELLEAFTITGIVHILSVSGSHISLLAAVIAWLALFLRLPRWLSASAVVLSIISYVILAGLVPPAVRSGIMGAVAFLGLILGRERDGQYLLVLTGLLMLLVSPLLLFHISFQLSFLATAGLLFLAPVFRTWLGKLPRFVAAGISITMGAQLATLPVLAWHFNQISISALLSNLVVVPLVDIIIVLGLVGGIAAFFIPMLGAVVFAFDSMLLGISFEMTRVMAALPFSSVWLPSMGVSAGLCYYAVLSILFVPQEYREITAEFIYRFRYKFIIVSSFIVVFLFSWQITRPNEMEVHFIDVGQGDAALVVTPHGHAMLFDTGGTRDTFDVGARVDVPYLLHYGIREVDYIFLSHAHEDHAAGAGAILARMPVRYVYTADEGAAAYARSMRLGDGNPLLMKLGRAQEGQSISLDGVTVDVLYAPSYSDVEHTTGNEVSNVYRVRYGNASFLFTGDLVQEHEEKMIARGIDLHTTVLKVPHHGSDTSSSEHFVQATNPLYAIYCVGADNSFGHPRPDVVARYERVGAQTLRTDRDGAIIFHTDGEHLSVRTFGAENFLGE
ncbi:DNA internalization-related competence protein ComEC/Rec2 [Selenomonas massiliensis]|uniref:DNA internalization-related competence protein ComEC/Rec2 n=1 Tax=Selenomonas massiliensis TaxID=2058293 RepID=UPI000D112F6E|nr:DNA internalization-related competence protein ComEC/Rec2 [Selenomonas massiliensis]